jgi:hypothetical protein
MHLCKSIGCLSTVSKQEDFCSICLRNQALEQTQVLLAESITTLVISDAKKEDYTGKAVSCYKVPIEYPMSGGTAYTAECGDIIEALGMDYNEGNVFKAIWRKCASRTIGLKKQGYEDAIHDSKKVTYFGERMVVLELRKQTKEKQLA